MVNLPLATLHKYYAGFGFCYINGASEEPRNVITATQISYDDAPRGCSSVYFGALVFVRGGNIDDRQTLAHHLDSSMFMKSIIARKPFQQIYFNASAEEGRISALMGLFYIGDVEIVRRELSSINARYNRPKHKYSDPRRRVRLG